MYYQNLLKYFFVFFSAFVVTYVLTPLLKRVALSMGMVDLPGKRRIHTKPIARCGGIAVFFGVHVGCAAVFLMPWAGFDALLGAQWWFSFLVVSLVVLLLGMADDQWNISPWFKLAGQTLAAVLAYFAGMQVGKVLGLELPVPLDLLASVIWFLAIINAFNLIDGMDGLATGLAALASMGMGGSLLFRHLPGDALVLLAVVGACAAFLRYNFHPAIVFLGDAGSMFLGFTLAAVSLSTGSKDAAIASIGVPILAMGIPVLDTFLAIWRRSVRKILSRAEGDTTGESGIFQGDMDHLHHRLVKSGISQARTTLWLYVGGLFLVVVGLLSMAFDSHTTGIFLIAFVFAVHVVVRHLARVELLDSGRVLLAGLSRPRSKVLATLSYVGFDVSILAAALAISIFLAWPESHAGSLYHAWFENLSLWVGIPFIALCLGRTYVRVWSLARISEYLVMVSTAMGGVLLASGAMAFFGVWSMRDLLLHLLVFSVFSIPALVAIRLLSHVLQDALSLVQKHPLHEPSGAETRILVCGAGYRCALFLRELSLMSTGSHDDVSIVGLLEADSNLHGRYVHGYRVMGGLQLLGNALEKYHVNEVVLTHSFEDTELSHILTTAAGYGAKVIEWKTVRNVLQE